MHQSGARFLASRVCSPIPAFMRGNVMNSGKSLGRTAVPLLALGALAVLALVTGRHASAPSAAPGTLRVRLGYFPNVTHAPAVVGMARGEFQKALGRGVSVDPKVFNAGPQEMEALLAGEIDLGYVGPGPAIDTYLRSKGTALKVIAGACSGGAALVARSGANITSIQGLNGK